MNSQDLSGPVPLKPCAAMTTIPSLWASSPGRSLPSSLYLGFWRPSTARPVDACFRFEPVVKLSDVSKQRRRTIYHLHRISLTATGAAAGAGVSHVFNLSVRTGRRTLHQHQKLVVFLSLTLLRHVFAKSNFEKQTLRFFRFFVFCFFTVHSFPFHRSWKTHLGDSHLQRGEGLRLQPQRHHCEGSESNYKCPASPALPEA